MSSDFDSAFDAAFDEEHWQASRRRSGRAERRGGASGERRGRAAEGRHRADSTSGSGDGRSFAAGLWMVVGGGVVLSLVLVLLTVLQGPHLSRTDYDPLLLVSRNQQRVVLHGNQLLAELDAVQLSITPAAPATIRVSGQQVIVEFERALHYDTEYTIELDGVQASYGGPVSSFSTTIRTAAPELLLVQRATEPGQLDTVVRTGLRDNSREVLFEAERIQFLGRVGQRLVVSTLRAENELWLVDLAERTVEQLPMPADALILKLETLDQRIPVLSLLQPDAAEESGVRVELHRVDLDNGGVLVPVTGLDGQPLKVVDWHPIPGSARLVVQDLESVVSVIDPLDPATAMPLGRFWALEPPALDGRHLVVSTIDTRLVIDPDTGERSTPPPAPELPQEIEGAGGDAGDSLFGAEARMIDQDTLVQRALVYDEAQLAQDPSRILLLQDGAWQEVYRARGELFAESFGLSPNGQFALVELSTSAMPGWDDYPGLPKPLGVSTVLVELSTGTVLKTTTGAQLLWQLR